MSNSSLSALLPPDGGLVSVRRAKERGVARSTLARAVSAGTLHRVRPALYADPSAWAALPPWTQFVRLVEAVLDAHPGWVASHHAALVLHDLPLHGVDLGQVDVAVEVRTSKVRAGVHVHRLRAARCRGPAAGRDP